MKYQTLLISYCLKKFKGERSIFGIYHLLKGKKSSQTIQDGKLYKMSFLFQVFPHLKRKDMEETVQMLYKMNWIKEVEPRHYVLTATGESQLTKFLKEKPIPSSLNGWEYGAISLIFWKRLVLLIQTISFLLDGKKRFIPLIQDKEVMEWVKKYLFSIKKKKEVLGLELYQELHSLLKKLPQTYANIFVLRLSGTHRVALTNEQVARRFNIEPDYAYILFQSVLHFIVNEIQSNPKIYHELFQLVEDQKYHLPLTTSAKKTYHLFKQNYSIQDIAKIRKLKSSTIEDHIVEIALNDPKFNIDLFVEKETQQEILKAVHYVGRKRLKPIKDAMTQQVSYFQIRLVLAKAGDKDET